MHGSGRTREDLDWCTFLFQKMARELILKGNVRLFNLYCRTRSRTSITFSTARILRQQPHRTHMFPQQKICISFEAKALILSLAFYGKANPPKKNPETSMRGKQRLWHRYSKASDFDSKIIKKETNFETLLLFSAIMY